MIHIYQKNISDCVKVLKKILLIAFVFNGLILGRYSNNILLLEFAKGECVLFFMDTHTYLLIHASNCC